MSPGAVTEKVHFFVAEYEPHMRISNGGGLTHEGEDIHVLELLFIEALAMIKDGRIVDGKTIMLLQYAALNIFRTKAFSSEVAASAADLKFFLNEAASPTKNFKSKATSNLRTC